MIFDNLELSANTLFALDEYRAADRAYKVDSCCDNAVIVRFWAESLAALLSIDLEEQGR